MRFLIVGLGSMGKRRIRNLKYLEENDIVGCDMLENRRQEVESAYGVPTCSTFEDGLSKNPDAIIISTPPDKHYDLAISSAMRRIPFFMEANVMPEGFDAVINECKKHGTFAAPSCTLRFQTSIKKIKQLISSNAIGKILHFTYHVGQYLPDWHPYEDYRTFYVSRKQTGACREIVPFELNWITWLMGNISLVSALRRKISNLETNIDDIYSMLLEFEDRKIGTVIIDVLSRAPYRTLKIFGEEGIITWEWTDKIVRLYEASKKRWTEFPEAAGIRIPGYVAEEDMYIEEMKSFINGIRGGDYPHSLGEEGMIMKLLSKLEQSSDEMMQVKVQR